MGSPLGNRCYADEEMLDALRAVPVRPVTSTAYRRHQRLGDPASSTIVRRFGTWALAVDAAGLVPSRSAGWTEGDLVTAVRRAATALGRAPTQREYDEWRRATDLWLPSLEPFQNRGGWARFLEAATGVKRRPRGRGPKGG